MRNKPDLYGPPSVPLDQLPGTMEFAKKQFEGQNLFDIMDGEYTQGRPDEQIYQLRTQMSEVKRMCQKQGNLIERIMARLGMK